LERALADQVHRPATLQADQERLRSVPGGARVGVPWLVACNRSPTLAGDQGSTKGMVADVGLDMDPLPQESGTRVHRCALTCRQGDRVRGARLSMGALGALRGATPVRAFYQRLVARGKPKQLALVAAARKLVAWAWAVFRSGHSFAAPKTVKLVA